MSSDYESTDEEPAMTFEEARELYKVGLLEKIADELGIDYQKPPWREDP
jgi:hypothetical protein